MESPATRTAPQFPSATPTAPLVMNDADAAPLIGISVHTIRKMRSQGKGPAYIKCGKSVRYRLADLEAYLEKQKVDR
ncbi:MAG: helix-turn-helix domain-containing protein [Bacteroidales bacterium]|nr:helix-turn-helix domain-containing protein [Bacteroidales bacterium]